MAKFSIVADGHYMLVDAERGIQFDVTRLRRDRGDLIGELACSCGILGSRAIDGVLSIGRFNFSSPRERHEHARRLGERARTNGKVDWLGLLEELCQRTLAADRAGSPAILLRTLPRPSVADALDIDGLRLFRQHPVIAFGDGGASKSYLALYLAGQLARRGLTVLFADWELAADDHRDRLERIYGARDMPDVLYVRCDRPMVFEADRLARLCRQHQADFLVCDSIAFACDGPPEAAEVAARYFQTQRQIGIGSLSLAHTNRSDRADEKPFGSAFWHNGARATWYVKRADESSDNDRMTVGLFNRKSNLGPLLPAVGYEITFTGDRTEFRRVNVADVQELASKLPLRERIRQAVKHEPQTLAALAGELGAKVDSVERTVRRYKQLFTRVSGADGVHRIALLERRSA